MSDKTENNFISGNFAGRWGPEGHADKYFSPYLRRPLVEECSGISFSDLKSRYKRKDLIRLAEREQSISVQFANQHYKIRLSAEQYQQKWRASGWSDVTRVWLLCNCGRRVRRLYIDPRASDVVPILACRTCLGLRYLSQNSGKTKWFRRIVKPLRKLIRRKDQLLLRKHTQRVREELQFIEGQIFILTQRAKPKRRTRRPSGARRSYRNVALVLGHR
jgi:hypothetical protein